MSSPSPSCLTILVRCFCSLPLSLPSFLLRVEYRITSKVKFAEPKPTANPLRTVKKKKKKKVKVAPADKPKEAAPVKTKR